MAEEEKFSLVKFISSFGQFLPWVKTARYVLGFLGIAFIGLTIYRAYFIPTNTTKQITHIIAQPGSNVTVEQRKEEKKSLFSVHPFLEGYSFAESDGRNGFGAKAGIRMEF